MIIGIFCNTQKQNQGHKPPVKKPPIDYVPMRCGFKNRVIFNQNTDSLRIISIPFVPRQISHPVDRIYSHVEIYDLADSLILCSEKISSDTHQVVQDIGITPIPAETLRVRAWGYYTEIKPDTMSGLKSHKLEIRTTRLFDGLFYKGGAELKKEKIDAAREKNVKKKSRG
jgi:hypothetical protein